MIFFFKFDLGVINSYFENCEDSGCMLKVMFFVVFFSFFVVFKIFVLNVKMN